MFVYAKTPYDYPKAAGIAGANQQVSTANYAANQPRELRVLERLEGISGSLQELEEFLSAFTRRLTGQDIPAQTERPPSAGIFDSVGHIEEGLRNCREIVRGLDEAF